MIRLSISHSAAMVNASAVVPRRDFVVCIDLIEVPILHSSVDALRP